MMSNQNNNTPPPWSEAPDWAMWLGQQPEGDWYAFSHKPTQLSSGFTYGANWVDLNKFALLISKGLPNPNWRETLEKRPE
jgi:hypothetical protein